MTEPTIMTAVPADSRATAQQRQDDVPARWCRACGNAGEPAGAACARCRTPLVGPDPGPPRIGRVVNVGNRILPKYAVVIGESVEAVSLLGKGDEVTTMPIGQFDGLRPEPVPGAAVVGASGWW